MVPLQEICTPKYVSLLEICTPKWNITGSQNFDTNIAPYLRSLDEVSQLLHKVDHSLCEASQLLYEVGQQIVANSHHGVWQAEAHK